MGNNEAPLFIGDVDFGSYKAADRKIRHVFKRASVELVAMVINFAHSKDVGVPAVHDREWRKRQAALDALLVGGYVEEQHGHWHSMAGGKGRCRTFRRTELLERTFTFRVPDRLVVGESSLTSPTTAYVPEPLAHNRIKANSITAL